MKERLEECDWSCLSECTNYGDRFALWYEKVTNLINEVCIKITIKKKNERRAKKPWISRSLLAASRGGMHCIRLVKLLTEN